MSSYEIVPPYQAVGFLGATKLAFIKAFTFRGRATRPEYWWFVLFYFLGGALMSFIEVILSPYNEESFLTIAFQLLVWLPLMSVSVRRLHDINRSGWWIWLVVGVIAATILFSSLIGMPEESSKTLMIYGVVIATIWYFYLMVKDGTAGPNHYGDDPKRRDAAD